MRDLRVNLAQIAPRLGDTAANLALHEEAVARARRDGADVVVFPELSLTGYHLQDQVPELALRAGDPAWERLAELSRGVDLVVGLVEDGPGHRCYNAAAYFAGGRLVHLHRKVFLPTYGLFQEGREFAAGETLRRFDTERGPVGMLVCEDLWHPTSAWLLAQQGAELLLVLGNGPTRGARPGRGITSVGVWRDLLRISAQFQTAYFVFVNRVGVEDGLSFGGGSLAVDPFGRVLVELPPLEPAQVTVSLRDEVLRRARTSYPLLRDADLELVYRELGRLRRVRYDLPDDNEQPRRAAAERRSVRGRRLRKASGRGNGA